MEKITKRRINQIALAIMAKQVINKSFKKENFERQLDYIMNLPAVKKIHLDKGEIVEKATLLLIERAFTEMKK
jgi:hypothetical protein